MLSELDSLPSVQLGDYVLRFELEDLSPSAKEIAEKELRETDEVKKEAIEELRELLKEQEKKGLTVPLDNDEWLVRFLRPCKFYPKSTCELVSYLISPKLHLSLINDLNNRFNDTINSK